MNTKENERKVWALLWTCNNEIIQWVGVGTIKDCTAAMYTFFDGLFFTNTYLSQPEFNSADGRYIVTLYDKKTDKNIGYFHFVEWEGDRELQVVFGNKRNSKNT